MRTISPSVSFNPFPSSGPLKRLGPLSFIIGLHVAFFFLLQSGLFRHAVVQVSAAPREVVATFITPQPRPAPEVPQPSPPKPKTVPVVKKAPPTAKPLPPVTKPVPIQQAESTPAETAPSPEPPAAMAPSSPAAPPAPAIAVPKTVSGVEYIQAPRPDYPPISKRMGEEGKVLLRVLINERGRPEKIEIHKSSGFDRLDEAARQSTSRALFKPHMEDGRPVAVYTTIPIDFKLNK